MADIYIPSEVPQEYDVQFFAEELARISATLQSLEEPYIIFVPQHAEPARLIEGMVVNADGTDWNPGGTGAGLYQRVGGAWVKL